MWLKRHLEMAREFYDNPTLDIQDIPPTQIARPRENS